MTVYLRQSTASQEVPLGHFVDSTDGVTAETALTINASDIKVWKTGATTLADKNSGGATHISGGIYYAVLDATDTNTIGPLVIFVAVSGALAVRLQCVVLDEAVYDVLFGTTAISTYAGADTSGTTTLLSRIGAAITITSGRVNADITHIAAAAVSTTTAQLGVNVVQISADGTAADNAEAFFDGTGYAGTNNVIPTVTAVTGLTASNLDAAVSTRATPAQILTTQLTEAYAADGAAPTLTQALMQIQQFLHESSVSGTTVTVKKVDGSTSAFTLTLNDATTPTAISRAT